MAPFAAKWSQELKRKVVQHGLRVNATDAWRAVVRGDYGPEGSSAGGGDVLPLATARQWVGAERRDRENVERQRKAHEDADGKAIAGRALSLLSVELAAVETRMAKKTRLGQEPRLQSRDVDHIGKIVAAAHKAEALAAGRVIIGRNGPGQSGEQGKLPEDDQSALAREALKRAASAAPEPHQHKQRTDDAGEQERDATHQQASHTAGSTAGTQRPCLTEWERMTHPTMGVGTQCIEP